MGNFGLEDVSAYEKSKDYGKPCKTKGCTYLKGHNGEHSFEWQKNWDKMIGVSKHPRNRY